MRSVKVFLGGSTLALAIAPDIGAQTCPPTVQPLVSAGDTVIGVGAINSFNPAFIGLTDTRMWTLVADTDFTDVQRDVVLLRNGFVTLREGASMIEPAGATLNTFNSIDLANNGNLGMLLTTRTPTSTTAYWNLIKVADFDATLVSPHFGAGTKWAKLDVVKLNSSNQMFVLGEVANPAVAGNREDTLIRYDLGPQGNILALTVLLTKEMPNAALGTTINGTAIAPTEHVLAVNKHGDYITFVSGFGGFEAVMINAETIVAAELNPSSVGTTWRTLDLTKVAINDRGDYVVTGALSEEFNNDPKTYLIERNGQNFARAGDVITSYSNSPLATGKAGPIWISNNGDVFWRAETQAGEPTYLRNYEPIVKSGVTVLDGNLITDLPSNQHSFTISPDGRYMIGRMTLQTVGASSVLVDFGLVIDFPGCAGNPGRLLKTSGDARPGCTFQLAMDNGQEPGVLPIIVFSTQRRIPGSECGVVLPAGELLISTTHRIGNMFLGPWNGSTPSAANVAIPDSLSLVDLKLYAQGFFRDLTGPSAEPTRMTNGLRIEIGAP
jgi:hypothetical protein